MADAHEIRQELQRAGEVMRKINPSTAQGLHQHLQKGKDAGHCSGVAPVRSACPRVTLLVDVLLGVLRAPYFLAETPQFRNT